jgi:hypothetical protein
MEWLVAHKQEMLNFPNDNAFFLQPLNDIAGILGPFVTSSPFEDYYSRMINVFKNRRISLEKKEIASICFALAVTSFLIKEKKMQWRIKEYHAKTAEYVIPLLIYNEMPNHPGTVDPIHLTSICLAARGKIAFDFYCWHIMGVFPDSIHNR